MLNENDGRRADPRTWKLSWCYGYTLAGYDQIERVHYWYDPLQQLPAVDNYDLRQMFPEIPDAEWDRLMEEAWDRAKDDRATADSDFGKLTAAFYRSLKTGSVDELKSALDQYRGKYRQSG